MREADEQFGERLAKDLERYLGPEIVLKELDLGDEQSEIGHLRATVMFAGGSEVLETVGETRLEAYNQLILRITELRLIVAVRHMDSEALEGFAAAWNAGLSPERR